VTAVEALGWTSGGLVMISGLPAVLRNLRDEGPLRPSAVRDALQLTGNLGWVAYGTLAGIIPIAVMCAVNAGFMALLLTQQLRSVAGSRRADLASSGKGTDHENA
jgi:hypothetical protein